MKYKEYDTDFIKDAVNKFNLTEEEFQEFEISYKLFRKFLETDASIKPAKRVVDYYEKYASEKEKQAYEVKFKDFFKKVKNIIQTTKDFSEIERYYKISKLDIANLIRKHGELSSYKDVLIAFSNAYKSFNKFLKTDCSIKFLAMVEDYYEKYASEEEKQAYEAKLRAFFEKIKVIIETSGDFRAIKEYYKIDELDIINLIETYGKLSPYKDVLNTFATSHKLFRKFLRTDCSIKPPKRVADYYEKYASEEETRAWEAKLEIFFEKVKTVVETTKDFSEIERYYNIDELDIIELIESYGKLSLYKSVLSLFEEYYNLYFQFSSDEKILKSIATNYGLIPSKFRKIAYLYASAFEKPVSNYSGYTWSASSNTRYVFTSPVYEAISKILELENVEDYAEVINQNNVLRNNIVNFCYAYHSELSRREQDELYELLLVKFENAKAFNVDVFLKGLYQEYVNSNLDLETFLQSKDISMKRLYCLISRASDEEVKRAFRLSIEKYRCLKEADKLTEIKENKLEKTKASYSELLNYIRNGINVNGKTRAFDLLDFFLLFKDSIDIYNIGFWFWLNAEDKKLIKDFFAPLSGLGRFDKDSILNSNLVINDQRVPQYVFYNVVSFLEDNNIPFYNAVFNIVFKKFMNGELENARPLQRVLD